MKQKFISCFTALLVGLTLVPASGLYSDVSVVKAADQQKKGNVDGYDYELWNQNGSGSVDMQLGSNGAFSCSWSSIENCLFRTGKKLGSTKKYQDYGNIAINYDVDYQPMGNSYMCVYGWTEDPTVEYYIVEAWGDWRPPGQATSLGTVTSDGNQYDIYKTMRNNQPSIHGTETFPQYWSVRKTNPAQVNAMKNLKGTITVSNHFKAWEKAGLTMGNMYEVALNIEGYRSSGKANVKKNELIMGGANPNASTGTSDTPSTPGQTVPKVSVITPSGSGTGVSDSFEGKGTDWTTRGEDPSVKLSTSFKHGGSQSLYVSGRKQSWQGFSNASSELKAGGSYSIDLYAGYQDPNYSSSSFTLGVQYTKGGETSYDNITDATCSTGKWTELSGDFSIPAGATDISLYVQTAYTESPTSADLIDFFIDDVKLTSDGSSSTDPGTTKPVTTKPGTTNPGSSTSSNNYMEEARANFTPNVPADVKSGDKGKTTKITYYSKKAQRNKPANVWLPPNYSESKKYPVLYMNHGIMGGEDDLLTGWGIREMASNLIAKGEVKPFIIVFTQMYTDPNAERPSGITQESTDHYDDFLYDLTESLMPYMSEHYSVAEGRENTAIAGFSMGGRESLYIGMKAADKIGYVCASSPAPGIVPAQDSFLNHRGSMTEAEFKFTSPKPYILMIGGGTADQVVGTFPKQYHELYDKNGTDNIWFEVQGAGHDASVGTPLFYNFFRNLFKASSGSENPPVTTTTTTTTTTKPPVTTSSTSKNLKGDVDCNGTVTSVDVVKLIQVMIGKVTLSPTGQSNADFNNDGKISIIDVIKLKNLLLS